jgi:hypothetical protein
MLPFCNVILVSLVWGKVALFVGATRIDKVILSCINKIG